MSLSRPFQDPTFATATPAASREEPTEARKATGYLTDEPLPAPIFNWLVGTQGDYLEWWRINRVYSYPLFADQDQRWRLSSVTFDTATVGAGSKRGLASNVTSGIFSGASTPLELPRVDGQAFGAEPDGAPMRLLGVSLNVLLDGPSTSPDEPRLRLVVIKHSSAVDEPIESVWVSDAYDTKDPELQELLFVVDPGNDGIPLDPRASYEIRLEMIRNDAADDVRVFDVFAHIQRPIGE